MKKATLISSILLLGLSASFSALAQNQTLVIAGRDGPTDTGLFQDVINKFVKPALAKDGIDVKFTPLGDYDKTLLNQLSAGTAADLFYLPDNTAAGLVKSGNILALDGIINTSDFIPSLTNIYKFGGKQYGIVKDFNTLAMYFNKDLFDQAGVAYPNNTDTWDTFADKITKVQKALGAGYYGTCFPADFARFGAFAYGTGWKATQPVTSASFVRAFDFYTNLVKSKVAAQPSAIGLGWGGDCLKSGKVATAFEGAWALGFLADQAPNLQYSTALIPRDPTTKQRGNFLFTVAWSINAKTKLKDAAIKALNLLTSKEAQAYVLESGLALPSRKSLQTSSYFKKTDKQAQANNTVFKGATAGPVFPFTLPPAYADALNVALKEVMDGTKSRDEALKAAQAKISAIK
jgi:multiple sugar transport system substrate-binding protein